MGSLFLIGGAPGCGKTTVAEALVTLHPDVVMVAADDYFTKDGVYKFDASQLPEAHAWCLRKVERLIREGGKTVVVHNTFTNTGSKGIQPYKDLADIYNLQVQYLFAVNHHGSRSTHNVPEDTVARMANECARTLALETLSTLGTSTMDAT
ncbi:MAG: AAA family ATPase [Rhodobacteraceae bacterium]|nr:AAA family ATPase [Paracoccaceae bacterium]